MVESDYLKRHPVAKVPGAIERVRIAMLRLPNVLERELVACQKTLEQKISDQGPTGQRVDPHLLGLAIRELLEERRIIKATTHASTGRTKWFSNARTPTPLIEAKLETLAPLYKLVSTGDFTNFTGDALEIITHICLVQLNSSHPRYAFLGGFDYTRKDRSGRYPKLTLPASVSQHRTNKPPDFYLFGFESGPLLIECKNYREWLYPGSELITELIAKALDTKTTPVLIARRIHYTALTNLLAPAGIIAHESYFQYYPSEQTEIAQKVAHKRSLGFSDVRAQEDPHNRTVTFFNSKLPAIADAMAQRFNRNRGHLERYVSGRINLAQLYNAIGSPASGNWLEPLNDEDIPF